MPILGINSLTLHLLLFPVIICEEYGAGMAKKKYSLRNGHSKSGLKDVSRGDGCSPPGGDPRVLTYKKIRDAHWKIYYWNNDY